MNVDDIFDSKPIQIVGSASVIATVFFNFALSSWSKNIEIIQNWASKMDINNFFVLATSFLGLLFLIIKIMSAWIGWIEKMEDRQSNGKWVPAIYRWIIKRRNKKKDVS